MRETLSSVGVLFLYGIYDEVAQDLVVGQARGFAYHEQISHPPKTAGGYREQLGNAQLITAAVKSVHAQHTQKYGEYKRGARGYQLQRKKLVYPLIGQGKKRVVKSHYVLYVKTLLPGRQKEVYFRLFIMHNGREFQSFFAHKYIINNIFPKCQAPAGARGAPPINRLEVSIKVLRLYIFAMLL